MTLKTSTSVIRQWAREQGIDVGDRGRLAPDVELAYAAAHSSSGSSLGDPAQAAVRKPKLKLKPKPTPKSTLQPKPKPKPKPKPQSQSKPKAPRRSAVSLLRVAARPAPGATGTSRRIRARSS